MCHWRKSARDYYQPKFKVDRAPGGRQHGKAVPTNARELINIFDTFKNHHLAF